MMKKLTALSLALVLLLSVCAGCGSKPASSAGSAGSEAGSDTSAPAHGEILIKLGASSSQTEPTGIAGQKFADLVNEKLAGKVKVEFYPGEQLGPAMEEVENMQVDLQQGVMFSFDNYTSIAKDLNIMSMAFAFDSIEHVPASTSSPIRCRRTPGPSSARSPWPTYPTCRA